MTLAGVLRNLGFLGVGLLVGALLLGGGASSEAVLVRGDSAKSSPLSTGPPQINWKGSSPRSEFAQATLVTGTAAASQSTKLDDTEQEKEE